MGFWGLGFKVSGLGLAVYGLAFGSETLESTDLNSQPCKSTAQATVPVRGLHPPPRFCEHDGPRPVGGSKNRSPQIVPHIGSFFGTFQGIQFLDLATGI